MVSIEIRPGTDEDAIAIAGALRQADIDEQWAGGYAEPLEVLRENIAESEICMTGLVDGRPVCMWGAKRQSLLFNIGTPWMLAVDMSKKEAYHFIRRCRPRIYQMAGAYDKLQGYIDARHEKAIRWLKWAGFRFDERAHPIGIDGGMFFRYWMEGER